MNDINRNLDGPYTKGVDNPYAVHVHPYPSRFHGSLYTRPVFGTPYVRNPYNVLKPNDFVDYYGVSGLGSVGGTFGGSTLGNGSIGGNTLGLGATGAPIYYLDRSNPKVTTLQAGINKVLVANRFQEIPVTGRVDHKTCAALSVCFINFKSELLSQVPQEIVTEAMRTCNLALKNSTVKRQAAAYVQFMQDNRLPVPEPLVSPTVVVPPDRAPTIPSAPERELVADAPPVPVLNPPLIEVPAAPPVPVLNPPLIKVPAAPPMEIDIPDMNISAKPASRGFSKIGLGAVVLLAAGVGYYVWKK